MGKKEPEIVEVCSFYIDLNDEGHPFDGDLHVLLQAIYQLLPKYNPANERMRVSVQSELIHKFSEADN